MVFPVSHTAKTSPTAFTGCFANSRGQCRSCRYKVPSTESLRGPVTIISYQYTLQLRHQHDDDPSKCRRDSARMVSIIVAGVERRYSVEPASDRERLRRGTITAYVEQE